MIQRNLKIVAHALLAVAVAAALWLTSVHSYLLFHSLVEMFGIVVAAAMFAVAWHSRRFSGNGYLTFIGIGYLFVAFLDLIHTLAYRGMGVFGPQYGTNLPTQLWVAARAMEAATLVLSPVFLVKRVRPWATVLVYLAASAALLIVIFPLNAFPACYVETRARTGLTPFKIGSEYVVCAVLVGSLAALWRVRERVPRRTFVLMLAAIVVAILSELAFTHYVNVYSGFNMIGHVLKTASYFLLFKATVEATLRDPYEALFRDLTEKERGLAEANRAKDEFLATLSHELRTPLNAVVGWSQMLLKGAMDEASSRRAVEAIDRNARAQVALINDVLDVSRIISGRLRLNVQRIDLTDPLDGALDAVRPAAEAKDIQISRGVDEAMIVMGDPDRLRQVIWNLLSNAVKFTPKGGRIAVDVHLRQSEIEIRVSDNGIGVPSDALPHLFERFWQGDRSGARQGGLGLGLAIVRHLVELHGGRVAAESAGPGQGTTVTAWIPVRAIDETTVSVESGSVESVPAAGTPGGASLAGVKVLVVDDEPDARELLDRILREAGALVRVAASSNDALRELRAWRPDLVLSDIGMPGGDGYELIRAIRSLPPEEGGLTKAVALTAYGRDEDRQRVVAAGFQQHITKPVTPAAVIAIVAAVIVRGESAASWPPT